MESNIVGYIRQYRDVYTREAITQQLLSAGYSPADVEAAWRDLDAETAPGELGSDQPALAPGAYLSAFPDEPAPPPRHPLVRSWVFWLTLIGTILLAYLLPGGLLALTSGLISYDSPLYTVGTYLPWAVCGLVQLGALVGGIMLLNRNRPVGMGLLLGLLFADIVLPVVFGLIIAGICVALIAGGGNLIP